MNVYLDYAATTPLERGVLKKMLPFFTEEFGNPDSLHAYGRRAAYAVTCARDRIAELLGVHPEEIYFTSGGTEADNWAVRCIGEGSVAISPIEHAAALEAAKLRGEVRFLSVERSGLISPVIPEGVGLVCTMAVNNETGCIQPIEEISAVCREREIPLFADCVQAALTQDLKRICRFADAISLSSHKIYGPKGVGLLYVRKGIKLKPLLVGGEQERERRGGTLNTAGIVGFAEALSLAVSKREEYCKKVVILRDRFEEKILQAAGDFVTVDGVSRAPNISHLTFHGENSDALLSLLDLNGVAASGGAACSAHSALPSHVMLAMGRSEKEAASGIRFSFGKDTTEEEVDFAADVVIRSSLRL